MIVIKREEDFNCFIKHLERSDTLTLGTSNFSSLPRNKRDK